MFFSYSEQLSHQLGTLTLTDDKEEREWSETKQLYNVAC